MTAEFIVVVDDQDARRRTRLMQIVSAGQAADAGADDDDVVMFCDRLRIELVAAAIANAMRDRIIRRPTAEVADTPGRVGCGGILGAAHAGRGDAGGDGAGKAIDELAARDAIPAHACSYVATPAMIQAP